MTQPLVQGGASGWCVVEDREQVPLLIRPLVQGGAGVANGVVEEPRRLQGQVAPRARGSGA